MVETQSGLFLGYIVGFELETDNGAIEKYYVRSKMVISGLWEKSLIINKAQIINFDEDKMVVDDAVVKINNSKIKEFASVENLKESGSVVTSESNNQ